MRQFWLALPVAAATATGLDLAGIDRSVAPGDDFFRHANGTWLEVDRDPGRPRELRAGSDRGRADHAAHGRAGPAGGEVRRRGGVGGPARRRLLREPHGRGGDRRQGPRAAPADARPHRARSPIAAPSRGCSGETLRADVDVAQRDELLHRQPPRPLGRPGPRRPDPLRGVPPPGRARHARPRVLPRRLAAHGGDPREVPGPRRARPRARAVSGRRGEGRAHRRPRAPDRRGARHARGVGRRAEGQQPLDARRSSTRSRPGSTGRRTSTPPASGSRRSSWSGSRGR